MLNRVTDYEIVSGGTPNELTRKVKNSMDKGWVPSGPLFSDESLYMQVLVKFG